MPSPVGAERWAAIRALREGEHPTFSRLAAATKLHPVTIRERALRDHWVKRTLPGGEAGKPLAERQGQDGEAGPLAAFDQAGWMPGHGAGAPLATDAPAGEVPGIDTAGMALGPAGLPGAGQDVVGLDDLRQRFADMLPRQLARIVALAERGIVHKARIDGLIAMGRALEKSETLAEERAAKQQKRSDDELAAMLEKIDDRIVELAEAYAERLVAERDRRGGG